MIAIIEDDHRQVVILNNSLLTSNECQGHKSGMMTDDVITDYLDEFRKEE